MTIKEKEKVFNIVNTTTTEQQLYMIHLISDKISINLKTKKGFKCYEINDPYFNINLNGIYIDINIQK